MAGGTGIRDIGLFRRRGGDEAEGVGGNRVALNGLLDARHMAGRALAAGTVFGVMSVFADRALEACGVFFRVAAKAEGVAGYGKVRGRVRVDLMAVETAKFAVVHVALGEVIALHAVFMGGEVGILEEVRSAGFEFFELPEVGEALTRLEADRPIVILSGDRIL